MTSRLRLLNKVRPNLSVLAAESVYNMIIVPLFSYCSLLKPNFTQTQQNKISSFERRAKEIVGEHQLKKKQISLVDSRKQRICLFVHKVITGEINEPFENYFEILNKSVNTRNKNILLRIPKLKLEYGRRSTKYLGAKIFNDLPINIRGVNHLKKSVRDF